MRRSTRAVRWLVAGVALVWALAYLHDPPWAGGITSGLRNWEQDLAGARYRWTNGHASFYIPDDVVRMTMPVRSGVPRPGGRLVTVSVSVDGHWLATRELEDPGRWVDITLSLPASLHARRFRRVEVRVDDVIPQRNLGVQLGEAAFTRHDPS
ncbi:MAG TPA: hypothetical protein VF332_07185 [Vicinamibacterales bacterium]|jgi:hypothetical protein